MKSRLQKTITLSLLLIHSFTWAFSPLTGKLVKSLPAKFQSRSWSKQNKIHYRRDSMKIALTPSSGSSSDDGPYDVIVVGTGNGGCALLSECLEHAPEKDYKILVLEQGQNFYYTSDTTHENGWSKTYSSGSIFKLHNTVTPKGRSVISGRAVTMGGGGSINYTMIHESSKWLAANVGQTEEYWDEMKKQVTGKLKRDSPFENRPEDFTKIIEEKATCKETNKIPYNPPNEKDNFAGNVPSLNDNWDTFPTDKAKQLYIFPTQFNKFGQRTNSGVSLVDWDDERIHLKCDCEVKELNIAEGTCNSVSVWDDESSKTETYSVKEGGKVVLCGGSASPRLLMRSKALSNENIGKFVRDHICMPLAIYVVSEKRGDKLGELIGPKNNYESIFATLAVKTGETTGEVDEREVVNLDFFSGEIDRLIFLVSSLYLAYLPFNLLKRLMSRFPYLFTILSNTVRVLLEALVFIFNILVGIKDVVTFQGWGATQIKITTSLVKFNTFTDGQYEDEKERITLGFFEDERDFKVAKEAIKENMSFLEQLGDKPPLLLRILFRLITKIPYEEHQIGRYVKNFSRNSLLSEQHLAGGALFGKVIDKGEEDPLATGRVFDTSNLYVADLSTVPLPRVSTQMTAYVIGHHVGSKIFGPKYKVE